MLRILFILFFSFLAVTGNCQEGFHLNENRKKIKIPFESSNNLLVVKVMLNNTPLNFILDTGVQNTILFSLEDTEKIDFKNIEKIKIKGLGSGDAIDAYKSTHNKVDINGFQDLEHEVYIVLDQEINFSAQLGVPIHGIIGYYFFKNHPIAIHPTSHKIYVYKDLGVVTRSKLKKYSVLPMSIELSKPYVDLKATIGGVESTVKMLVDTGGSDAVWLFENDSNIQCPSLFYEDFLGRGFSGDIFGKRSRISDLKLVDIAIPTPTVSFPSAVSLQSVEMVEGRNGSIGSGILRRFDVIYDYLNQKMYVKKNSDFDLPFNYNMSGMEIQHNGKEVIQESVYLANLPHRDDNKGGIAINFDSSTSIQYKFMLKPIFEVVNVRKNSPADKSGIMKGDLIKKINGQPTYKFKLNEIIEIFQSEEGRILQVEYERAGKLNKTKIQLEKIL